MATDANPEWQNEIDSALGVVCSVAPCRGCSTADLTSFQQSRGIQLPAAYLRFLQVVGRDPGAFLKGSDFSFELLERLQSGAEALLEDDNGPPLPQNAFVFCSHEGYQFLFFEVGEGPDPAVHFYLEGEGRYQVVAPSFSRWLAKTVQDEFGATKAPG